MAVVPRASLIERQWLCFDRGFRQLTPPRCREGAPRQCFLELDLRTFGDFGLRINGGWSVSSAGVRRKHCVTSRAGLVVGSGRWVDVVSLSSHFDIHHSLISR